MAGLLPKDQRVDYYSKSKTKSAASKTLFIAMLPRGVTHSDLEALFKYQPGFVAVRKVRGLGFVDFASVRESTNAMLRFQGYRFKNHKKVVGLPEESEGLVIDYDKDIGKNEIEGHRQQAKLLHNLLQAQTRNFYRYSCSSCLTFVECNLMTHKPLEQFKVRKSDGSTILVEEKVVVKVPATKFDAEGREIIFEEEQITPSGVLFKHISNGERVLIRREKGFEEQYRLMCESCGVCLGYRSVPHTNRNAENRITYFLKGAVKPVPDKLKELYPPSPFVLLPPTNNQVVSSAVNSEAILSSETKDDFKKPGDDGSPVEALK